MTASPVRVSGDWLALREPADAAARSRDLVERLRRELPQHDRRMIHDLGAGSGAMGRWLAPLLPGPQHWVLHDRDADLLTLAGAAVPALAADDARVTVETRHSDITGLRASDLDGAALITASALLDMLTAEELTGLVGVCAGTGCPVLLTLSVVGRVELTPADPLDARLAAAFDTHQRRLTERGRLLGPDAVSRTIEEISRTGGEIHVRPSPWRLGAGETELLAEWLTGWVGAACEQDAELTPAATGYTRRRLAQLSAGELRVTVEHADLLVLPGGGQALPKRGESA